MAADLVGVDVEWQLPVLAPPLRQEDVIHLSSPQSKHDTVGCLLTGYALHYFRTGGKAA